MLERLVARQYVMRSAGGDRHALSLKMFALAHRHPPVNRLVTQALPVMDAYARQAEQSCHLGLYDRGNVLIVAQVPGPGNWGLSIRLGARVGLLDTGSGHVLLACQTPERRAQMLAEHTPLKARCHCPRRSCTTCWNRYAARATGRAKACSPMAWWTSPAPSSGLMAMPWLCSHLPISGGSMGMQVPRWMRHAGTCCRQWLDSLNGGLRGEE